MYKKTVLLIYFTACNLQVGDKKENLCLKV